jgi:PKHD-type hydroxylase
VILCVADILAGEALEDVRRRIALGRFVDGRLTAGWHARAVKNNRQLTEAGMLAERLRQVIEANEVVRAAVLPRRTLMPLIARYEPGMSYGLHVDDALMGRDEVLRSDIALTLFLDPPEAYEGGELLIDSAGVEQRVKLPAGSAVLYPATSLHRVEPVTAGQRHVAVSWIQSLVRDPARREILFDLDQVRRAAFQRDGKSREFDLLAKSYANLLRMWAEV